MKVKEDSWEGIWVTALWRGLIGSVWKGEAGGEEGPIGSEGTSRVGGRGRAGGIWSDHTVWLHPPSTSHVASGFPRRDRKSTNKTHLTATTAHWLSIGYDHLILMLSGVTNGSACLSKCVTAFISKQAYRLEWLPWRLTNGTCCQKMNKCHRSVWVHGGV